MDPISLIVAALAAGAAAGVTDTASTAVKDAYTGLRELVRRRLAGRAAAEVALAEHESAPEIWRAPLVAELDSAGAATDEAMVAAAQRVMAIVDEAGTRSGKYVVDLRGAQGVQVGDGNFQANSFSAPPTS
ncbi:MAG: hypothetical protein ACRDS1_04255 [Pseudonocardiaceae bacterium]